MQPINSRETVDTFPVRTEWPKCITGACSRGFDSVDRQSRPRVSETPIRNARNTCDRRHRPSAMLLQSCPGKVNKRSTLPSAQQYETSHCKSGITQNFQLLNFFSDKPCHKISACISICVTMRHQKFMTVMGKKPVGKHFTLQHMVPKLQFAYMKQFKVLSVRHRRIFGAKIKVKQFAFGSHKVLRDQTEETGQKFYN